MAKLVYKGKINGNDVVYKEGCFHGPFADRFDGGLRQNIMEVVTETGKKFRFRAWSDFNYVLDCLAKNTYMRNDYVDEVIIKEKRKKTLKCNSRNAEAPTVEGKRTRLVLKKANEMYNGIRRKIVEELKEQYYSLNEKPKDKKLENLIVSEKKEKQIEEEVEDIFNTDLKKESLYFYKNDPKKFIEYFSKIGDKSRKKELLNTIFSCDYENKEVIEWLNKNELDLLREAGFNS